MLAGWGHLDCPGSRAYVHPWGNMQRKSTGQKCQAGYSGHRCVLSFFCYQNSLRGNILAFFIPVLSPCHKCLGKNSGSLLGGWPSPYPCALGQGHSCCLLGTVPWCWGLCVSTLRHHVEPHPCPLTPGACPTASKIMTKPCPHETYI